MGAAKHIKAALKDKKLTQIKLAEMTEKPKQTVYNMMHNDEMLFSTVEMYAEALGCEVVLRDKETGKIY